MSSAKVSRPVDDIQEDEARGLELAATIETLAHGEKATVVVLAGCWLLATVIVQAIEQDEDRDELEAVAAVTQQLCNCVMHLRLSRAMTKQ